MLTRRHLLATLAAAAVVAPAVLAAATAAPADPPGKSGSTTPLTLRLAVVEYPGKPAARIAERFARQVASLSRGSMHVAIDSWPTHSRGDTPSAQLETRAVAALGSNHVQLGLLPSHAFEQQGVSTLRALQTPFLLTSEALAARATAGPIATRLQAGLSTISLTGLGLIPAGMERPFGFLKPLLTPADFAGVRVRADSSRATRDVLRALGARPIALESGGSDTSVYSGFVDDAASRPRAGNAFPRDAYTAANAALFPRVDVLVASNLVIGNLRPAQRAILLQAVARARTETLSSRDERAAAAAFCRAGGTIVRAPTTATRALRARVEPLVDAMRRDPATAALVAELERLPVDAADELQPCAPTAPPLASAQDEDYTRSELASLRPAVGSYRRAFTVAQLRAAGADEVDARANAGLTTLTFWGPAWSLRFVLEWQGSLRQPCRGRIDFPAHFVELSWNRTTLCSGLFAFRWKPTGRGDLAITGFDTRTKPRWIKKTYIGTWTRVECTADAGWPGPDPSQRTTPNCTNDRTDPPRGVEGKASYSPNGSRVVYATRPGRGNGIWISNTDGGGATQLTGGARRNGSPPCPCDRDPSFSPDGRRVAFLRTSAEGKLAVFLVDAQGGEPTRVTPWSAARKGTIEWGRAGPRLRAG
jgi:TRAP-type C4-dicarboxylate transport system substrate-binding protein